MATKVKETPVLTGEDARRFERLLIENAGKKVSKEERERADKAYKEIIAASNKG